MGEQLHIAHRGEYLRGRQDGHQDALADRDYRPCDAATGTRDQEQAYGVGYADGYSIGIEETS